jgi:hypothetical protein
VRTRIILSLTVLALVATACSRGNDEAQATDLTTTAPTTTTTEATTTTTRASTTTTQATTTTMPGPVSPLNGLPVEDETLLDRQLVAVKIDNHWNARPQSGVQEADAIMELLVEAGLTRFVALFHTTDSEFVGPMRSGRPTDPTLVRPLNGVMTISGAQPWVVSRILSYDVPLIGDLGRPVTFRYRGRFAPHNLYTSTLELRNVMEQRGYEPTPPPQILTFGEFPAPATDTAEEIVFDWSTTMDVTWRWDGERYLRFAGDEPHNWRSAEGVAEPEDTPEEDTGDTGDADDEAADDNGVIEEQIAADTIVVLTVDRYTACPSGAGSCVPAFETTGSGTAIVFSGGRYVEATWERDDVADWFTITDIDGNPIPVPPGKPWIAFFPGGRELSW